MVGAIVLIQVLRYMIPCSLAFSEEMKMPVGSWVKIISSGEVGKFMAYSEVGNNILVAWVMTGTVDREVLIPNVQSLRSYLEFLPD